MFAHYPHWIPSFSEKRTSINSDFQIRLASTYRGTFAHIKRKIVETVVTMIDPSVPLLIQTDASDCTIATSLRQFGRPVAFFSRTLSRSERRHSAVEKEAYAIVKSLRRSQCYLISRYFKLITDQKSVTFMLNSKTTSRIKN